MNANEISPEASNFRLNRIKKVSKCFRLFLQFGFPLMMLAVVLQSVFTGMYASPVDLSQGINGLFIIKAIVSILWGIFALAAMLVWYWTSLKLFRFFERGVLFATETAHCFKIIGITFFAGILAVVGLYLFNPLPDQTWPQGGIITSVLDAIYNGAFWIFLGWLFDEAQKIQEEQELTV